MGALVDYERHGRIGVIVIGNPPVNALGAAVRAGLLEALDHGSADASTNFLVLVGAGRTFPAGADIREFGKPPQPPLLPDVINRFEASAKPVVAAIHGTALGGGLELALGCHFRVALKTAKLGLPEVKLGLMPGAGGTQRLPRLIGAERALDMILSGDPVTAAEAHAWGLVDDVDEGDSALEAGIRLAERFQDETRLFRWLCERCGGTAAIDPTMFADRRKELAKRARHLLSPHLIVDAVEAAMTVPLEEGLERERALFLQCLDSPQRAGLVHAFFAEREVAKVPGLPPDTPTRPIDRAAVVGAGTMGGGIAMCFANVGIPVRLLDADRDALDRGLAIIRRNYESSARRGRLSADEVKRRIDLIAPTLEYDDVADADLVVEAVYESMDLKTQVFARLDAVCKPGAILATNTSTLDINAIAAAAGRPGDVVGMHFFSPANVMRLLENVRADRTADDVVATVMALARRLGKVGVLVGVCYGFVGNRMLHQRTRESSALVEEGASPEQVDRVLTDFGFPMGPFAMTDLAGVDVGWRIREERRKSGDPDAPPLSWLDRLAEQGRFGQKTGAGIYRYEPGSRTPLPDPEVDALLAQYRRERGTEPRPVPDQEILERCLYVMVNEGARILEEGIAARSLDIDVIWIHGYGFPAFRGGPMFWAEQVGLKSIHDAVADYHRRLGGAHWQPAPLLARLARTGGSFRDP